MTKLFISLSFALALTLLFGFRHAVWQRPKYLLAYFTFFFLLELAAHTWLLPPNTFGVEVGYVLLGIAVLCLIAIAITRQVERRADRDP